MEIPLPEFQLQFCEVNIQEKSKGKTVHYKLLKNVEYVPDKNSVTSVSVIPLVRKNTIIATKLARGIDIPGGHVESYDDDLTSTVLRESFEEAAMRLVTPLLLIGIISSDLYGLKSTSYMLITAAKVRSVQEFKPKFEAVGREEINLDNFLDQYDSEFKMIMLEAIKRVKILQDEIL